MHPLSATRPRTFFPTAITTFRQCPERYYHYYIRKRRPSMPFSRPMVIGGATHRIIASILPMFLSTGDCATDLEAMAMKEISTTDYPDEERQYLEQDARDVASLTRTALEMVPERATSLLQERNLYARLGRSEVEIGARVDLVTRNLDGTIEHIDFKTGKIRDNTVQSLMARAVVGQRFRETAKIQTTTLFLAQRHRKSALLDRESSKGDWRQVADNIRDIRSLEHFPPRPGPLCTFCPYQARHCSVW